MDPKPYKNNTQLAFDILRGLWLLRDAEALLPYAKAFIHRETISADENTAKPRLYTDSGDYEDTLQKPDIEAKKVVVIPLHGATTKYWNCSNDGTLALAETLEEFAAREDVIGFVLDVDSPGGAANSIMPLVQAIWFVRSLGKPIIAHCDQCASAALWIASQCDAVYMDNEMSEIGSLGAYASVLDNRTNLQTGEKIIYVYADESGDKNKAVREALEGRYDSMKKELSALVSRFRAAVEKGRPNLNTEAEGVLSGAMFYTEDAISVGLADGQLSLQECIENVFIRAEINNS